MSNISLPCNKRESGSTTNVNRTEAQGGKAGIREVGSRVLSNQNRESLGGRQQAGIGLEGSLNIIRGESAVFTHFQDVTTKRLMIGSHCIMRAKGMVEGTNIRTKKMGTLLNLKTKRLDMGQTESTFNEVNFVERGQRYLHIACCIIKIYGVGV